MCIALGVMNSAGAQTPPQPAAAPAPELQDVVVTGTRIARTGFDAPTPTTVMDTHTIDLVAAPTIGQLLADMPMFEATNTPATTTVSSQYAGQNNLNLRGLGTEETLVLVDGRRFVPSTSGGLIDTNVIPSSLISRVEVVTGGASAAYGSNAVAGVVNIILKKDLDGIFGDIQGGVSERDDNKTAKGSLGWGTSFAAGQGHFVIVAEGDNEQGVGLQTTRSWASQGYNIVGNPNYSPTNGQPTYLIAPNAQLATATPGGLIVSGPLRGTAFGAGGTPYNFNFTPGDGFYQLGGNGISGSNYEELSTPLKRSSFYSRGDYDIGDVTLFFELSHSHSETYNPYLVPVFDFGDITINRNNYYLDTQYPSLAAQLPATGPNSSFAFGRYSTDIGYITTDDSNATDRIVVGLEGKFGATWKWNAYGEYGRDIYESDVAHNLLVNNYFNSIAAVAGPGGKPVCAANLASPNSAPGCVPVNLFGIGSPSSAAINYFTATQWFVSDLYEHDLAASLTGDVLSLHGEPVSVAMGAEFRSEGVDANSDRNSQATNFLIGNPQPLAGAISDKEAFVEVAVPVLRNLPLAKSLDLNAAARFTDYDPSGPVRTWKLGATWAPVDDLRFRVTRSQDIRAPALVELYTARFELFDNVVDPVTGQNVVVHQLTGGNPNLKPEVAQTLTAGFVVTPSALPGFRASVDVYDINIEGAISTLAPQTIINLCYQGQTSFCSLLTRNSAGVLTDVNLENINVAELHETGLDVEMAYLVPLSDIGFKSGGNLRLKLLVNNLRMLKQYDGSQTIDYAGDVGGNNPYGLPKWRANLNVTYENGPFAVDLMDRYIGSGIFDATQPTAYSNNRIPSVDYVNLSLQYSPTSPRFRTLQYYVKINNLLDKAPPIDPEIFFANIQTNPQLYDVVGRMYYAGVRFRW